MVELPPLRALQVFEAVGRFGSMTKAAQELKVSPGAISQQIKILEEAMGLHLVARKGNGLALTEVGLAYHQAVAKAFADFHKASSDIVEFHRSSALIISALPLIASRWLSPNMFTWQKTHPNVCFHLEGTAIEPVLDGKPFDFRITYADKAHLFESFVPLFNDGLVPVCSPELAASQPLEKPADLLAHRLLTIDWRPFLSPAPTWQDWFRLVGLDGSEIRDFFMLSLSSLAIEAAIEGRGIALAQKAMVAEELRTGRLIAPFEQVLMLPSPYILAWNRTVFDKTGASEFHRWIVGLARKQERNTLAP
ncbi:LysR substrate-binding domain-containing protein [Pseudaminobacter sp. NGMCC 1.201702]|uniref:LysR substrate-binding domain-containing protein n=1 Tax=Pseudaminobacter sp. NGMCC 1.201702 TaxID=3391825 RepID=UPI0039F0F177